MPDSPDATLRFTDRVDDYVRYRPTYPEAIYERLALPADAVVADIGSGTGISSELFLRRGHIVFGVEPNLAMRQAGEQQLRGYPKFASVAGTAEDTTLAGNSVDLVIAAQAFHWFELERAKAEFARILRPPGRVALVWNSRRIDSTPFLRGYEQLLLKFGTDYRQVNHQNLDRQTISQFFVDGVFDSWTFDNVQEFDLAGLEGRVRSSSYAPPPGHPNYDSMMAQLRQLFADYAQDSRAQFEYDVEVFLGRVHSSARS